MDRYTLVQTDSGDWFVVPADRGREFYELELEGEMPDWARYINSPEEITFADWTMPY